MFSLTDLIPVFMSEGLSQINLVHSVTHLLICFVALYIVKVKFTIQNLLNHYFTKI